MDIIVLKFLIRNVKCGSILLLVVGRRKVEWDGN